MSENGELQEKNTPQNRPDYEKDILELITSTTSPKVLREELNDFHANDIAETFTKLSSDQRIKVFRMLDAARLAEIMTYLDEDEQIQYLNEINIKKTLGILNEMEPQGAASVLRQMSSGRREIVYELLDSDMRKNLARIYAYGDDVIGSQMETDYIEIPKDTSVKDAMRSLRDQTRENETDNLSILYTVDENGLYYGALRIKDLFAARTTDTLADLIEVNFPFVYATENIDTIMEDLKDYAEDSIPVLRGDNTIEGVITRQNLLSVMDQRMSEDYAMLAGLSAEEDLQESLFESLRKRTPWLLILLFLSLGVSTVVSMFEGVVAKLTVTVAFQSLVLDMAGNVGTQSLAVSIRVLADKSITRKDKLFLILKECRTGFVNGLILGAGSAVCLGLFIHFWNGFDWMQAYAIAICVGASMMLSMVISSLTGTCIPIAFESFGVDPAAASGPLITTMNDLIGVTAYYSMVYIFLIQILHI